MSPPLSSPSLPALHDPATLVVDGSELSLFQSLDGPERRRCCLVVYNGSELGRQMMLDEGISTIGRSMAARLQIEGTGISRLHAELNVVGSVVTLRDLGSANGSQVRDQPLGEQPLCLVDGDVVRLGSVILKFYEHRSLDAELHDRVYRLAMVDAGTGVFNRRYLHDALRREVRVAQRTGSALTLICYDLDRFKLVNDSHGHAAGDLVLRESAATVRAVVQAVAGSSGILGRQGGEEFCVLLAGSTRDAAMVWAEQIRVAVANQIFILDRGEGASPRTVQHRQTISLGVAEFAPPMRDGSDLLAIADRWLYQAKHGGRNRVCG